MKLNIRKKVAIAFAFFIITSTIVWALNFLNHYTLTKKIELIDAKIDLLSTVLESRRYEKNFLLYFNPAELEEAIRYVTSAIEKQKAIIEKYKNSISPSQLYSHLEDLNTYHSALKTLNHIDRQDPGFEKQALQVRNYGKIITDNIERIVQSERQAVRKLIRKTNGFLIIALCAIFVLTAVTALFIHLNINNPLKQIENAIRKIAKGDYSSIPPITTGDIFESLVNSVNRMIKVLNNRNEQLLHSEKLASLGTLTSGVAHELNNPLNNISTSVQILTEELEDGDVEYKRMLLQETEKQIERARDIIKGLLEFSRDTSFVPRDVDAKSLVERTMRLIKGEIPSNINIHFELQEDLMVRLDPFRIQRLLMNLIINAVHAMETEGGDLTIRSKQIDDKQFIFQIQDTGTGIPEEDLERIFDPFYTTKDVGKGTGLGLSISHGIVKNHKGRIEVKSKLGQGTIFTVHLPLYYTPSEESVSEEERAN